MWLYLQDGIWAAMNGMSMYLHRSMCISQIQNGWQYLDSLGGAAYTSAKEEYVERPFLVMQTAMHQAEVNSRNEVEYE